MELSKTRQRVLWATAAGISYTISLHKYVNRDNPSTGTGVQGVVEFIAVALAVLFSYIAVWDLARRSPKFLAVAYFACFGILSLASSWRSFSPSNSVAKSCVFFAVLLIVYLLAQAGLARRFLQSVYWAYVSSILAYLLLDLLNPARFPVWDIDEWSGRTRLSVFATFPGTMGETSAYLVLLAPLLFTRGHWISRVFLVGMNVAAGGKTSTVLMLVLLVAELAFTLRRSRRGQLLGLFAALLLVAAVIPLAVNPPSSVSPWLSSGMNSIYGSQVTTEAADLNGRTVLWRGLIGLIADGPLMGYGMDGARDALLRIAPWAGHSHNAYIDLALSGGVIALAAFLMGVFHTVRRCWAAESSFRGPAFRLLVFMMIVGFTSITLSFPSCFGLLLLVFLAYESWDHPRVMPGLEESHRSTIESPMNWSNRPVGASGGPEAAPILNR